MLQADDIKTMLFTILCICSIFYLSIGIYSYNRDTKSKANLIFFALCTFMSLWAIGYAFMLISPNIEIANRWRIISTLGYLFLMVHGYRSRFHLKIPIKKKSV